MAEINPHKIDMAAMASIQWKYWQARLKGVELPINPNFVPWGFYVLETRDRSRLPVAIWESDGVKYYRISTAAPVAINSPDDESAWAHSTFQYIRDKPLRKAAYHAWVENGVAPPLSEAEAVVAATKAPTTPAPEPTLAEKVSPIVNEAAGAHPVASGVIGHNSGNSAPLDPKDIAGKIAYVMGELAQMTAIKTQSDADRSITFTNRLGELIKEADAAREAEKRPHLDKCNEIDGKWNPSIIKPAREESTRHSRLRGAFATIETKRRKEEAEAAARAAQVSQAAGNPVPAAKVEPVEFKAAGGGRSHKPREIKCAKVVDQDALYEQVKGYEAVRQFLKELADKVYYSGGELHGCEPDVKIRG